MALYGVMSSMYRLLTEIITGDDARVRLICQTFCCFRLQKSNAMILDEKNYREVINRYTMEDWRPLLDLISEIEGISSFGEVVPGRVVEEGVTTLPYMSYHEVIGRFTQLCYEIPVMVNFDWGAWKEGDKMLRDPDVDFDSIDIPDKCRLITAIVRTDRFSEGYLGTAFESGLVLKILQSIRKQLSIERD